MRKSISSVIKLKDAPERTQEFRQDNLQQNEKSITSISPRVFQSKQPNRKSENGERIQLIIEKQCVIVANMHKITSIKGILIPIK